MRSGFSMVAVSATAGLLVACGGGGGGGGIDDSPDIASIEGGYTVVGNDGSSGDAVILEDGTLWAIGGTESGGGLIAERLFQGTLMQSGATGSTVTANNIYVYEFDPFSTTMDVGFSGTVAQSGVISGSLTATGLNPVATTLTPSDPAVFNYDTPATLPAIAGTWDGLFSTGDTGAVSISPTGEVSSLTDQGCSISGSAAPRASGKNVYDVTITFGPAPCALPNGSASGIGVIVNVGAERQLTVAVDTADRSLGAAFFGTQ